MDVICGNVLFIGDSDRINFIMLKEVKIGYSLKIVKHNISEPFKCFKRHQYIPQMCGQIHPDHIEKDCPNETRLPGSSPNFPKILWRTKKREWNTGSNLGEKYKFWGTRTIVKSYMERDNIYASVARRTNPIRNGNQPNICKALVLKQIQSVPNDWPMF